MCQARTPTKYNGQWVGRDGQACILTDLSYWHENRNTVPVPGGAMLEYLLAPQAQGTSQ